MTKETQGSLASGVVLVMTDGDDCDRKEYINEQDAQQNKLQLACEDRMRRHDGWREDPETCQRRRA